MKTKRKPFTLLELLAAMTVFTIFMLAVMRLFGLTQDVISNATGQTGQTEKVRAVMDLIATDLQNIYYEEGVNTLCYYPGTNSLDLTVYRPAKMNGCKTNLVWVRYEFDSSARTLSMSVVGDDQYPAKWKLDKVSSTAADLFPASSLTNDDKAEILDGVYSFNLKTYDLPANSEVAISGTTRLPDKVRIEIKLIDPDVYERYKVYKADGLGKPVEDTDLEKSSKVFTRDVIIDRGQF